MSDGTPAPTRTVFTERHTINLTKDMDDRFQQLLLKQDRSVKVQDLFRAALRQYLDDQEDLIGSRRHFSKSLQNRLDSLENTLVFYLTVIIYLLAASLAVIVQATTRDSKIQSVNLIRTAIASALKDGPTLNGQINDVRERLQGD